MHLRPIPRVAASAFRPARRGGEPRVVTGVAETWSAFERGTPAYLRETAGDQVVDVSQRMGAPRNFGQSEDRGRIPFRDYLDWVLDTSMEYVDVHPRTPRDVVERIEADAS